MSSIPQFPFVVSPVRTDSGPAWLVCDSTDQVIATCPNQVTAGFVAEKLNHRTHYEIDLRVARAFVSTMLASFRVNLEQEFHQPLSGLELDAAIFLRDLAQWFGLNNGETAIACGPDIMAYVAQLESAPISLAPVDALVREA